MSSVRTGARSGRGLRSVLVAILALALTAVGFIGASPSAEAATSGTFSGTGEGSTKTTKLEAGLYRVVVKYSGNSDDWGATNFIASMESTSGAISETLVNDIEESNRVSRKVDVAKTSTVWMDIELAADDAEWTITVKKLSPPSKVTTTATVNGTAENSSNLFRLKAGLYTMRVTYSGNTDDWGATNFIMDLTGRGSSVLLVNAIKASGTVTRNVRVSSTGVYWFQVMASSSSSWTVKFSPLKKSLTKTPTPKISGTAKVGKTLKAVPGTWKPSGVKLSYQWYRNGTKITGATHSTYTVKSNSKGKKLQVKVTGKKSGYTTVTKTWKSTATVK